MRSKWLRHANLIIGVLVFIASLVVFVISAPLDPDPHHDGVQIVPAIAVAQGIPIHVGVYDHYGPITAWLHAAGVMILGPQLLSIRVITALLLAVGALLIFILGKQVRLPTWLATMLSLTWVALWPGRSVDWVTYLFLPWPSITVLVIQLGVALALLSIINRQLTSGVIPYLLGALVGLGVMTRPNAGAPTALAVALIVLGLVAAPLRARWQLLARISGAAILVVVAVVLVLMLQGALDAYVNDVVVGPLTGKATDGTTSWFFYRNVVLLGSLPILAAIAAMLVAAKWKPDSRLFPWILAAVGAAVLIVVALTSVEANPLRDFVLRRLTWAPALDHQAFQLMFVVALATPVALVVLFVHWWHSSRHKVAHSTSQAFTGNSIIMAAAKKTELALGALALASLFQLYPFIDPNHLWWAAPIPLVFLFLVLRERLSRPWSNALAVVLLVPPLAVAVPRFADYVSVPRERIESGVLRGMLIGQERLDDVGNVNLALEGLDPRATSFDCWNGLFAVWNGQYLSNSSRFVNWASEPGTEFRPATSVVKCVDPNPDGSLPVFDVPDGYFVSAIQGPVSLSYYNYTYLVRMDRFVAEN